MILNVINGTKRNQILLLFTLRLYFKSQDTTAHWDQLITVQQMARLVMNALQGTTVHKVARLAAHVLKGTTSTQLATLSTHHALSVTLVRSVSFDFCFFERC